MQSNAPQEGDRPTAIVASEEQAWYKNGKLYQDSAVPVDLAETKKAAVLALPDEPRESAPQEEAVLVLPDEPQEVVPKDVKPVVRCAVCKRPTSDSRSWCNEPICAACVRNYIE
jgi:hypothetical protein